MKKMIKSVAVLALLTASSVSMAGWSVSGGYTNFSDNDDSDFSLGAIYASAGYEYNSGSLTFMPEIRLGTGVSDDTFVFSGERVDVEINSYLAASVRAQYNVTRDFAVFLQPSYARLDTKISVFGRSVSDDSWEFGFGGGARFNLTKNASLEALYESFDGTDVISVGFRHTF